MSDQQPSTPGTDKPLRLDKERGVNPAITVCPACGTDVGLVLLGVGGFKKKCLDCNTTNIGYQSQNRCGNCKSCRLKDEGRLREGERVPDELCDDCAEKQRLVDEEVKSGGVYWKCSDCHSTGALKEDTPLAAAVRDQSKIAPPDPVGIEFSKEHCPVCNQEELS